MTDRDTGKLKGYGFCEFMDLAVAESAKRNPNGREYNGRQLRVDFARRRRRGGGEERRKSGRAQPPRRCTTTRPWGTRPRPPRARCTRRGWEGGDGRGHGASRGMSPAQLFSVMNKKTLTQQNQSQARQLLVGNPQLTLALFQAQLALGMTKPQPRWLRRRHRRRRRASRGAPLPPPPGGYPAGDGCPGDGCPGNAPASGRPGDAAVRRAAVPAAAAAGDGVVRTPLPPPPTGGRCRVRRRGRRGPATSSCCSR